MSEEFAGPYTGWINVKSAPYSATGNGTTNDQAAIAAAFAACPSGGVVYFPAGTYRVNAGLYMQDKSYVTVIGEDPATTSIVWGAGVAMTEYMGILNIDGCNYSRFSRLTLDGQSGTAWACIRIDATSSPPGNLYFPTGNEFSDLELKNAKYGIIAGSFGTGVAESTVKRCRIHHNTYNGYLSRNFNTLDWWFWDCYIHHNNVGIGNHDAGSGSGPGSYGGAGNCHAYRTIFEANTTGDVWLGNCEYFSFRDCWSTGSGRFLYQYGIGDGNPISIQRCTILDPVQTVCVDVGSPGPVILVDSTIRSLSGVSTYVVGANNVICGGNTYSSAGGAASSRRFEFDTETTTTRAALLGLAAPSPAAFAPKQTRTVFEVTAGSSRSTIQTAITNAAATGSDGSMAVVHLQRGTYSIDTALTVPANKRIQIVGDGALSQLNYTGNGLGVGEPVFDCTGPSHVTIRDLGIWGNGVQGSGVKVGSVDQAGARVLVDQLHTSQCYTGVFAHHDGRCTVETRGAQTTNAYLTGLFSRGSTLTAWGGAHGANESCYVIDRGGTILVYDTWYEGAQPYLVRFQERGNFTIWGTKVAAADPNHGSVPSEPPSISLEGHEGRVSVIAGVLVVNNRIGQTDGRHFSAVLALGCQGSESPWFVGPGGAQSPAALLNSNHAISGGAEALSDAVQRIPNTARFVRNQLAAARAATSSAQPLGTPTVGTSDVRLHRLDINQAVHAVWPYGNVPALTQTPTPADTVSRLRTLVVADAQKTAAQAVLDRTLPTEAGATLVQGLNASGSGAATHWWCSLALTVPQHEEVTVQLAAQLAATTVRDYDATTNAPSAILSALSLLRTAG
jgi:hypothetical protein